MEQKSRIKRNVVIYVIGVLALAITGGRVAASGNQVGGLIFAVSPFLMAVLIRVFGRGGWSDAGLSLNLKAASIGIYLV